MGNDRYRRNQDDSDDVDTRTGGDVDDVPDAAIDDHDVPIRDVEPGRTPGTPDDDSWDQTVGPPPWVSWDVVVFVVYVVGLALLLAGSLTLMVYLLAVAIGAI